MIRLRVLIFIACIGLSGEVALADSQQSVKEISYQLIKTLPHRPTAFTQGLQLLSNKHLLESTGLYGASSLAILELETAKVIDEFKLPKDLFGEGATYHKGEIYQLTYRAGKVLVYDMDTFTLNKTLKYSGQGWGLTSDGDNLIMSDGTADLIFRSADDFKELRRITVTRGGKPQKYLNELEWVEGLIFANVWQKFYIIVINPTDGTVIAQIDIRQLYTGEGGVANGIAWDAQHRHLLVTGKRWSDIFVLQLNNFLLDD